ncbi:nitrilase-related carbon-nitrogen hydrolase [Microbispora sp. GKU 823]|uniref:nitrilase-related carbon-nitrogen hydrolase n=1 Tax=Microbispora sp. GKU 823 TaxID=1652100 RepID=UPI0021194703|nr:nitrilase-related carbon-nitrogen hydrolase [Microbispora sp. GKU 823]
MAEPAEGPTVTEWGRLAKDHDLVIVGGFCELADGLVRNSQVMVDSTGTRAVYRKAHLWHDEQDVFAPGDAAAPVVDTALGRIGMMVCYDLEFPEWVRAVGLAGADLLAVSTNWPVSPVPAGERPVLVAYAQVAAAANRMFVAVADRCAAERGVGWVCGTSVIGPDGYPLAGPVLRDGPPCWWPTAIWPRPGTRPPARATTSTATGGRICTRSRARAELFSRDRGLDRRGRLSSWPTI